MDRSTNPENLSALAARFVEIWFAQDRGVLLASRAFSAGFARRKGERTQKPHFGDVRILSCADRIRKKAGHVHYIRVGPGVSLKLKPSQNM